MADPAELIGNYRRALMRFCGIKEPLRDTKAADGIALQDAADALEAALQPQAVPTQKTYDPSGLGDELMHNGVLYIRHELHCDKVKEAVASAKPTLSAKCEAAVDRIVDRATQVSSADAGAMLDRFAASHALLVRANVAGYEVSTHQQEVHDANTAAVLSAMRGTTVPVGYVVVPKKPTEEMLAAGFRVWEPGERMGDYEREIANKTYSAMIAAAPETAR